MSLSIKRKKSRHPSKNKETDLLIAQEKHTKNYQLLEHSNEAFLNDEDSDTHHNRIDPVHPNPVNPGHVSNMTMSKQQYPSNISNNTKHSRSPTETDQFENVQLNNISKNTDTDQIENYDDLFLDNTSNNDSDDDDDDDDNDKSDSGDDSDNGGGDDDYDDNHIKQQIIRIKSNYKILALTLSIGVVFWFTMLCVGLYLYIKYHDICTFSATLELFGVCLLIYINIKYIFELCLLIVLYIKRVLPMCRSAALLDDNEQQTISNLLVIGNLELEGENVDRDSLLNTVYMGSKLKLTNDVENSIDKVLDNSDTTYLNMNQGSLNNALYNVTHLRQNLPYFLRTDIENDSKTNTPKKLSRKTAHHILLGIETIPLLSIIFYVIIALNADSSIAYSNANVIKTVCHPITIFNWITIVMFIFQSIIKMLPVITRVLYKLK